MTNDFGLLHYKQKWRRCASDHALGRHDKRSPGNSARAYSTGEFN